MNPLEELRRFFSEMPDLSFAVLEESHADGAAQAQSDWDIAVQWQASVDWLAVIGAHDGKVLIGEGSLNWMHFLTRTWRGPEYFYWEQAHAA